MNTGFHIATLRVASLLNLVACVVGVLMLLAFPMERVHQYASHFRTPEARLSIEQHTPIAHPDGGTTERIADQAVLPALLVPIYPGDVVEPIAKLEFSSLISLSRRLLRIKFGSSRDGRDPLL